jgi:uncharacterized SAM-binding protein YcdF (DUF218 family)
VALRSETTGDDSDIAGMKRELVMRNVSAARVRFEPQGRNTREQALETARLIGEDFARRPVLVVTSPEHLKRAVLSFRKAGFEKVAGGSAYQVAKPADLKYESEKLGGHRIPAAPDVGQILFVRYIFWVNLNYEYRSFQEYCALAYYLVKGWI